ncbi:MAG TPA: hypothetical protein DCG47_15460 [Spirochaetaceae bacterium]|jgi:ABC-2 type transport system permease protein|nr:hypothetical protein [Spirochaetaceae bacterium]
MTETSRYLRFTRNSFARMLSYRSSVLFYVLGSLTQTLVLYYLWKAVFEGGTEGRPVINGFSFPEMVAYLVMTVAAQALVFGNADDVIADEIMDGSIAMNLARPIDYRKRIFFDNLGVIAYNLAVTGLPAAAIALAVLSAAGIAPGLPALALTLLSLGMAFFMNFYYRFCIGLMAILTTNMWGFTRLEAVVASFLSGALIPLSFFPLWARTIAQYLPFASLVYAPAMVFLGKLRGLELLRVLAVQALWLLAFRALSSFAWSRLVKRLAVNGG